jgi:hypothetical protein
VKLVALAAAAATLVTPAQFVQAHQAADGGFAEPGGRPSTALTAWAALGLVASEADPGKALDHLRAHEADDMPGSTRALVALAEAALGDTRLASSLSARTGAQTNTLVWTILARRQASLPAPRTLVRALLARQAASGGWSWTAGGAPDSNDTAAAVQALRSADVVGKPIRRGLTYLRSAQGRDGGFALLPGRSSDAQSTAWAVQAFLAAGSPVPKRALTYLQALRQPDGSYALSRRYATTPVWVTAQVLPAVTGKAFPLPRR